MKGNKITFTYLNIRQSIVILLAKLIVTDFMLAGLVIGFYLVLVRGGNMLGTMLANTELFLLIFGLIGFAKILLTVYIVLLWLNEYYEITPESVVHRTGIIFSESELYDLDFVRAMEIRDSFLGEIFNFATITLYDLRMNKYLDMYLIHNPQRYAKVLKELRPTIEIKEGKVRLPFMPSKGLIKEYE